MPHVYTTSREKRMDMWLGFAGWLAFAAALVLVTVLIRPAFAGASVLGPLISVTFGVALLLLITRPYAAFGFLLAPATVVGLVVVEVPFFLGSLVVDAASGRPQTAFCSESGFLCFVPPPTTIAMVVGFAAFLAVAWFSLRGIDRRVR